MPVSNPPPQFTTDADGFIHIPGQIPFRLRITTLGGAKRWTMELKDTSNNEVNPVIDSRNKP